MITKQLVENFLSGGQFAIVGVSRNPNKFGHKIYFDLKKKGYKVYAVNPNAKEIKGDPCFHDISSLPKDVRHLVIITPKDQTEKVLKEALTNGIRNVWIQQESETPAALEFAEQSNMQVIHDLCIYMFAKPVKGVHNFHRCLKKWFGKFPE